MTKKAPIVWINGFPGAGKLTIANAMATLHGEILVLDNHKLIDPVAKTFSRAHPDYHKQRKMYRQAVLEQYVCDPSSHERLVVFTDFQSDNELGQNVAREYKDAAFRAGRPFIPVYLFCDPESNIKRAASPDRINSGTTKLTDTNTLSDMLSSGCRLFRFDSHPGLSIDSTDEPPIENAKKIFGFIKSLATES